MERTLVLVKPDGVKRALVGEVISRLERKGLCLVGMKLMKVSRELAERHYDVHRGKPFFPGLIEFITSGPVVAMAWEGPQAVEVVRSLMGATDCRRAAPGTIRGDLGLDVGHNLVHGSDSPETAARELSLFFRPEEIVSW
ncbi:MAG TPA: nucleoside-diphosphate kinase, partial [Firmicutes bacterium]|nr:nucleoside-diphosphate kinase [Bacillota bacterium]